MDLLQKEIREGILRKLLQNSKIFKGRAKIREKEREKQRKFL